MTTEDPAALLEGAKLRLRMSIPSARGPVVAEDEVVIGEFKRFLPAGPTEDGEAERKRDMLQFYDNDEFWKDGRRIYQGRLRTISLDSVYQLLDASGTIIYPPEGEWVDLDRLDRDELAEFARSEGLGLRIAPSMPVERVRAKVVKALGID